MPKLGRMPCLANNQVRLLINGEATFTAIFDAIRNARQEAVLIGFFIIHDDQLGRRLQTLLMEKAAEGVAILRALRPRRQPLPASQLCSAATRRRCAGQSLCQVLN